MPSHGIYAPIWPKESSSTRVKRLAKRIVVGLLLITLVVLASYGYLAYYETQQQMLQASENADASAAREAVNQLQIFCMTHRSGTQVWGGILSSYYSEYQTIGIHNPSHYDMSIGWWLVMNYWSVGKEMRNGTYSNLRGPGTVKPTFVFKVCFREEICIEPSCLLSLPPGCSAFLFNMVLRGDFNVTGTYGTYHVSSVSTYNSTSQTGTGALASIDTNLPLC